MVDRRGAHLDREPHAGPGPSWLPWTRSPSPASRAGVEHRARLLVVEGAALAEDVDPRACGAQASSIGAADQVDVLVGAALVLGRDQVGAEEGDVVGELGGQPAEALLGLDRQAVPRLDLLVGDPGGERLGVPRPRERAELVVGAARVASVVSGIPPASYGAPAIRAANSSARSPAKIRWVWLSTKPGIAQRPAASRRSSAAAPAGSIALTSPSSITSAQSRTRPSGPSPSSGPLVTRAPMPVDDQAQGRPAAIARARARSQRRAERACRRGRSRARRRSLGRRRRRVAANTAASSARSAPSREPDAVEPRVTRSASAPGASGRPRPSRSRRGRPRWPREAATRRRGARASRSRAARRARRRAPPRAGR